MSLPTRTADTMSDAIALSSPSGRMSKRARRAAENRLSLSLFGPGGLQRDEPTKAESTRNRIESLRRSARDLRELAARGMSARAFAKKAAQLEDEAARLESETV